MAEKLGLSGGVIGRLVDEGIAVLSDKRFMMRNRRAAIVSPLRTPVGKFLGALAPLDAGKLGSIILKALIKRSGIDPLRVDDVVFSQGYGNGEAPAIGHWSWLAADLPIEVPDFNLIADAVQGFSDSYSCDDGRNWHCGCCDSRWVREYVQC